MMTNVELPKVLAFESEDHVLDFIEAAREIIPKIKFERVVGEGYNCILYTRKDKQYRAIMGATQAPVTIIETPVEAASMSDLYVTGATFAINEDGSTVLKTKNGNSPGYFTMPMDPGTVSPQDTAAYLPSGPNTNVK